MPKNDSSINARIPLKKLIAELYNTNRTSDVRERYFLFENKFAALTSTSPAVSDD